MTSSSSKNNDQPRQTRFDWIGMLLDNLKSRTTVIPRRRRTKHGATLDFKGYEFAICTIKQAPVPYNRVYRPQFPCADTLTTQYMFLARLAIVPSPFETVLDSHSTSCWPRTSRRKLPHHPVSPRWRPCSVSRILPVPFPCR